VLLLLYKLCLIAALQPTSQNCQAVSNVSISTFGLLTGSRNRKCPADTWILSALPGQHIELIVRDYTSRGVATSSSDNNPAADDHVERGDDEDEDDVVEDRKSRFQI